MRRTVKNLTASGIRLGVASRIYNILVALAALVAPLILLFSYVAYTRSADTCIVLVVLIWFGCGAAILHAFSDT